MDKMALQIDKMSICSNQTRNDYAAMSGIGAEAWVQPLTRSSQGGIVGASVDGCAAKGMETRWLNRVCHSHGTLTEKARV